MRATCAVAALVAQESTNSLSAGFQKVDKTEREGTGKSTSVPAGEHATLPPSKTTSGLMGQSSSNRREVALKGESSPGGARARQPAQVPSAGSTFVRSVHAPTMSAFQACAGSWIGWVSLSARWSGPIASGSTLRALTMNSRRAFFSS